jgi:tetratricopeptide (TPR) repeat protein
MPRERAILLLIALSLAGCSSTPVNHAEADRYFMRGMNFRESGEFVEAARSFALAIYHNPGHARAHMELGREQFRVGERLRDTEHLDDAIGNFKRAAELDPNLWEARCLWVAALRVEGEADEALELQRGLVRDFPDQAELHNNLGNLLLEREEFGEAEQSFRRALSIRSDYPLARGGLGIALWRGGNTDAGVEALRRAVAAMPTRYLFRVELARALLSAGNPREALEEARAGLALERRDPTVYHILAEIHAELGQFGTARKYVREVFNRGGQVTSKLRDTLDMAQARSKEGVRK